MSDSRADETAPESLILIVVGAHLHTEQNDRPTAYALRDRIASWLATHPDAARRPLVCTDVWYLNDARLNACPTISIGGPTVNALTAYLTDKLPNAFVIDDVLSVQMDLETGDTVACLWGIDAQATAGAADTFVARYLDTFMPAAAR